MGAKSPETKEKRKRPRNCRLGDGDASFFQRTAGVD